MELSEIHTKKPFPTLGTINKLNIVILTDKPMRMFLQNLRKFVSTEAKLKRDQVPELYLNGVYHPRAEGNVLSKILTV